MATIGIYRIRNTKNGKFYLGSSDDIVRRWKEGHKAKLVRGVHDNPHLQNAWNKYGKDSFLVEVLRECSKEDLLVEEQKELDVWVGCPECYNIRKDAKCIVLPGSNRPEWVKQKISLAQKGKPRWTEEQKKQMSIQRKGRKHSPETIEKFIGRKSSRENIKKAQLFNVGRVYSEEHKAAISVGKIISHREKIGA